ncbi:MAG: hypothetical protein DMF63_14580 [Acidobacteria bacterium]|nr:MAG: hypothetical protein DMF63_14580 [Acidobacteriota bacterium]
MILGTAGLSNAQRRNEKQIRDSVRSLNAQIDDFQYGLDYQLKSTSSPTQDIDGVHDSIRTLQTKVDDLEENLNNRKDNRDDIHSIIIAAKDVDAFLKSNPQNQRIDTNWNAVRTTINSLATNYGVVPDWETRDPAYSDNTINQTTITQTTRDGNRTTSRRTTTQSGTSARIIPAVPARRTTSPANSNGLTGTYQIDLARSEKAADIVSGSNVGNDQRQDLESKLDAPEQIAIDIRGNEVTLASSKAQPVSFVADGREKTEQENGRTVRLKATLRGQELTITSLGGETDYAVTFVPQDNGRSLKVTRRITTDYLEETIFAESVYNKTDDVAGLGIAPNSGAADSGDDAVFSSNDPNDRPGATPTAVPSRVGEFIVPSGTIVSGFLETAIDTKTTQNNDRFKLTVQSPDAFRGATIDGFVTGVGRSGRVSGRSNMTFHFETITLRDGQRYDFAGYLQSMKDHTGKAVRVDPEGTVRGGSQTKNTAKRGGLGAGIGAIIGAIAGGGTGAAIGAVIGGGAGAGSVLVQGRDDLQLMKGTMITIQSTSPNTTARRAPTDN